MHEKTSDRVALVWEGYDEKAALLSADLTLPPAFLLLSEEHLYARTLGRVVRHLLLQRHLARGRTHARGVHPRRLVLVLVPVRTVPRVRSRTAKNCRNGPRPWASARAGHRHVFSKQHLPIPARLHWPHRASPGSALRGGSALQRSGRRADGARWGIAEAT